MTLRTSSALAAITAIEKERPDAVVEADTIVSADQIEEALDSLPKPRRRDPDEAAEAVRRAVRSAIAERWNKKPICHVHVLVV